MPRNVTTMTQMWKLLQAHTLKPNGEPRPVNHNNEWGGFSRLLGMPVFTAWADMLEYDRATKGTTALVSDAAWVTSPRGLSNQEKWLKFAEDHGNVAAFFIIHAQNPTTQIRAVKYIDADRVFVGNVLRREGKTYISGKPRSLESSLRSTPGKG